MRLHQDQEDCLLLDCAGNSSLGHPYDIHREWLDDGSKKDAKRKKKEKDEVREPRKCLQCGAMYVASVPACPECGFVSKRPSDVMELDTPLQEIGEGGVRGEAGKANIIDKQLWYSSLLSIQRQKGYKDGWAANQYRAKFSVWPAMVHLHDVALDFPSPEVSSWVKHRMIKWAKSRARA
jgi:hypothetical protein